MYGKTDLDMMMCGRKFIDEVACEPLKCGLRRYSRAILFVCRFFLSDSFTKNEDLVQRRMEVNLKIKKERKNRLLI